MAPSRCDHSRRVALRALPLLPAAAALGGAACDRGQRFPAPPALSAVAILRAGDYGADFADIIGLGLRELGIDVRGRRVVLKPNMVEYEPGTAINTNPALVAGAAAALLRAGAASVLVGEGPGHATSTSGGSSSGVNPWRAWPPGSMCSIRSRC